jgi:hypothetical protein
MVAAQPFMACRVEQVLACNGIAGRHMGLFASQKSARKPNFLWGFGLKRVCNVGLWRACERLLGFLDF